MVEVIQKCVPLEQQEEVLGALQAEVERARAAARAEAAAEQERWLHRLESIPDVGATIKGEEPADPLEAIATRVERALASREEDLREQLALAMERLLVAEEQAEQRITPMVALVPPLTEPAVSPEELARLRKGDQRLEEILGRLEDVDGAMRYLDVPGYLGAVLYVTLRTYLLGSPMQHMPLPLEERRADKQPPRLGGLRELLARMAHERVNFLDVSEVARLVDGAEAFIASQVNQRRGWEEMGKRLCEEGVKARAEMAAQAARLLNRTAQLEQAQMELARLRPLHEQALAEAARLRREEGILRYVLRRAESDRLRLGALVRRKAQALEESTPALAAELRAMLTGEPETCPECSRLRTFLSVPEVEDFLHGVVTEAAFQQIRWGAEHDAGKADADWFWLVGYLAGKVLSDKTEEKRRHHIIAVGAVCLNWLRHRQQLGSMRPGIVPPGTTDS